MIPRETIDSIFAAARIEEVVGDFVNLKKRGSSYIGLCPFHNERTPSFTVNPARGTYKCFGCGKGGNSVKFVMEHEKMDYVNALKYIAGKYHIEIVEAKENEEQIEERHALENLRIVCSFAQKFFIEQLYTEEGKAIGLSYFEERGFTAETIEKFGLGYSPENPKAFVNAALKKGYDLKHLYQAGLIGVRQNEESNNNEPNLVPDNCYDRYRGRVIFPIFNPIGNPIAFAGRTLKNDKNIAKYVNSKETLLYEKSKVLYGMNFARKKMTAEDNCYLVEGYADVISMHQSGIENVVASSGTSLTEDQVGLIRRFTSNLTILYDGDSAGLKAAERGLKISLALGMDVKIITLPPEDDPDTFARKNSQEEIIKYLKDNASDVLMNSIIRLSKENDPLKKAENLTHIASLMVEIPDRLKRNGYFDACLNLLNIEEEALRNEMGRAQNNKNKEGLRDLVKQKEEAGILIPKNKRIVIDSKGNPVTFQALSIDAQEKELVRVLIKYGSEEVDFSQAIEGEDSPQKFRMRISDFIIQSMEEDGFILEIPDYKKIYEEYYKFYKNGEFKGEDFFLKHHDPEINQIAFDIFDERYTVSNWSRRNIGYKTERDHLTLTTEKALYAYFSRKIEIMIREFQENILHPLNEDELVNMIEHKKKLDKAKAEFKKRLGRVI